MSEYVSTGLRRTVRTRANGCCEYCLIHEDDCLLPHEPDHVIAMKHQGETTLDNLAWTCFMCNRAKGSDIASIDPESKDIVRLFSPRLDDWTKHLFVREDGVIYGTSAIGRATTQLLRLNRTHLVEIRRELMKVGLYPTAPKEL